MDGSPGDQREDHGPDRKQRWWEQGEEPDYRATLANERTFLAWTRTSLAMLAGALAIVQFHQVGSLALRLIVACYLIALASGTIVFGYLQWRVRQSRMRQRRPLGRSSLQAALAVAFLTLAVLVIVVVVTDSI